MPGEPNEAPPGSPNPEAGGAGALGSPTREPTPGSAPSAVALDLEPAAPIVLAADLTHATRIAFDGSDVLVLHHPSLLEGSTALDEIVRVPRAGGSPELVVSAPRMGGFVVDGDRIWVSSLETATLFEFDKATGEERTRTVLSDTSYLYQVVQSASTVFASHAMNGRLFSVGKSDGAARVVFAGDPSTAFPAQWLLLDESSVYFLSGPSPSEVSLWRASADGSGATTLAAVGSAVALGAAGEELVTVDNGAGEVVAFSKQGARRTLGHVEEAWALTADSETVYISKQPFDSCPEGYAGEVVKLPLAGGEATVLARGLACPSMLLVGDDGLYWVNNGYASAGPSGEFVSTPTGSLVKLSN